MNEKIDAKWSSSRSAYSSAQAPDSDFSVGTKRRITLPGLAVFFCSLLFLTWLLVWSDSTHKVDRLLHDSWVRINKQDPPEDVVIAAIDSVSLKQIGRWPWPRATLAQLFENLQSHRVRAVVIDVLFTEYASSLPDDMRLARAIANLPNTVLPVLTEDRAGRLSIESLPIPGITRVVDSLGHINLPIDDDGIVRRIYLKAGKQHAHWPALSLAALEGLGKAIDPLPGVNRDMTGSSDQWVENNEVLIPFYGPSGTIQRVSAIDIIQGNVPDGQLDNKIVFIGMTTKGLGDVVPTAVSALDQPMPGVEIHASVFSALRDGVMVESLNPYINLVTAFVLLTIMLLVYSRAPPDWALLTAIASALVPILISFLLYRYARVWLAPLSASVPILISYLLWSRHRLQYVNRFLEQEHAKFGMQSPRRQTNDDSALVEFFESAYRHLPVEAWRFSSGKQIYAGGADLPRRRVSGGDNAWALRGNVYARRYPGKQALHIEFAIADSAKGVEVTELIDSLSRVRAREQATVFSGSIERLQTNAQTLREQLEWLRSVKAFSDSMLAGSPAGFAVWNAAGECVRANDLTYQLVPGFSEHGELLEFVNCIDRDGDKKEDARHLQNLLLDCDPWQVTYRQGEKEMVINFRAVGDRLTKRLVCASIVDVSDIRTSERARAEMVDYLSHDLRSPLISALCLLDTEDDPRIEQNINTSLSMMDNLLHVARADDLSDADFQPVLLNAVLDNTLDQLLPQALSQDIHFDIDTDDTDFWVNGDAASLERALTNIVGNAIKYSPQGTTVTVRLHQKDSMALLTVDDQGVGIAPEMLGRLFNRFKRDSATAGEYKGIGLGLALVSRVVNLHNGTVAASNIPAGTRISLQIPIDQDLCDLEPAVETASASAR